MIFKGTVTLLAGLSEFATHPRADRLVNEFSEHIFPQQFKILQNGILTVFAYFIKYGGNYWKFRIIVVQ